MLAPGLLSAQLEAAEFCPLTGELLGAPSKVERALRNWRGPDPQGKRLPDSNLSESNAVLNWLGRKKRVSAARLVACFGPNAEPFGFRGESGESLAGEKLLVTLTEPNGTPRDQCEINREALAPLLLAEHTRAGCLVAAGPDGRLQQLEGGLIADRLTRHVVFARWAPAPQGEGWLLQKTEPPAHVCAYLASERLCGARPLEALLETPTLTPSGQLLSLPGYYPECGFLLSKDWGQLPQLSPEAALAVLREPFRDFDFCAPEGLSVALAAVLTIVARPTLWAWSPAGAAPGFAIDAADGGHGKTLLTDVILGCAGFEQGSCPSLASSNPEEQQKRIDAALFSGRRVLLFNNVKTGSEFGSAALDDWLTSPKTVEARVLGASELRSVANLFVVLANGNQISFAGETARRFCRARIRKPAAPSRTQGQLEALVFGSRGLLVAAALTLLQERMLRPRPLPSGLSLASFELWSWLVAGAIEQAGLPNPILCQRSLSELDAGREGLAAALAELAQLAAGQPKTVAELRLSCSLPLFRLFQLLRPGARERPEQVSEVTYSRALAQLRDRELGGLALRKLSGGRWLVGRA